MVQFNSPAGEEEENVFEEHHIKTLSELKPEGQRVRSARRRDLGQRGRGQISRPCEYTATSSTYKSMERLEEFLMSE